MCAFRQKRISRVGDLFVGILLTKKKKNTLVSTPGIFQICMVWYKYVWDYIMFL